MSGKRLLVSTAAVAGAGLMLTAMTLVSPAASASASRATFASSAAPSAALAHPAGALAGSSEVNFDLVLNLRDASGAAALVKAVSDPTSTGYRHYATTAQWEARFSPTSAQVQTAESWLRGQGLEVGAVSADRVTIAASGTVAQVEKAFDTELGNYTLRGQTVREASRDLSVPSTIAGVVSGVMGVNQVLASPDFADPPPRAPSSPPRPVRAISASRTPIPSTAIRTPGTPTGCQHGLRIRRSQLRSAYTYPRAATGAGETIAIIDAYDSSTITSDAIKYFALNDPSAPLKKADLTKIDQGPFDSEGVCAASGWQDEEAIDIESAHSMAPGSHVLFVGAKSCYDQDLFNAEQTVIDGGLANVISNVG